MTKQIPLTQGQIAIVDDEDYEELSKYKWYAQRTRQTFYAARKLPSINKKQLTIAMHQQIMGAPPIPGMVVDHKEHPGTDNRRDNLRWATRSQNTHNRRISHTNGTKGITYAAERDRWLARITANGVRIHLGYFKFKQIAVEAYRIAAIKYHGEFAHSDIIGGAK